MRIELNQLASAEQVFQALETVANKGANVYVEWTRDCQTRKSAEVRVQKLVRAPIRFGVSYANLSTVRDAITRGLREEVESLPWGTWKAGYVNRIIEHKGNEYVRFTVGSFDNMRRDTRYMLNDRPAEYAEVLPYLLASETRESDRTVFNVRADSIIAVGSDS